VRSGRFCRGICHARGAGGRWRNSLAGRSGF